MLETRYPQVHTALNPAQQEAVHAGDAPLLIVAGAGTGKTRTLTARMINLIERGVPPQHICMLTFTNKAAKEMAERANLKSQISNFKSPFIGTFHSLGARILRNEARHLGRTPDFVIFDDHDSFDLIKKLAKFLEAEWGTELGEGTAFFRDRISRIKNGLGTLPASEDAVRLRDQTLRELFLRYERAVEASNAFDFDDLIEKVVFLFRKHPDARDRYRNRFSHILVDEYQDVNNMQYELIRHIAGESRKLSVVGDDAQMIYGWRGSNMEIFMNFERDWPGAHVSFLKENYRSTKTILAAASSLISHNRLQRPKTLVTANPEGSPISLAELGDEEEEAQWIVKKIKNEKENRKKGEETIAILYRTNAQSRAIEQALIEHDVPYLIYGGLKFYERREIKDILAALRYVLNPKDEISRDRLQKTFKKRLSEELFVKLPAKREESPSLLIRHILSLTHYDDYLKKNFSNSTEREENIAELIHFASLFTSLAEFIERVTLLQSTDTLARSKEQRAKNDRQLAIGDSPSAVELMTMHLSKGLEFERVFIAGCAEGLLPHARSLSSEEGLEEERRLMYVAVTRAKQNLSISFYGLPSRFLAEIPEELVAFKNPLPEEGTDPEDEERYIRLD